MTLSLQKFMLVLLFKILFVSSATSKLRLPILKENNSPKNQSKSENGEKKSQIHAIPHFERSQAKITTPPPVK